MFNYLETLQNYGDRCAYRVLDGANVTEKSYIRYLKDANIAAARLEEKFGDLTGKHIGIFEQTSYEYAAILAAIIFSRAVAVPLNNLESEKNVSFAIKTAKLDALIADNWMFADPGVPVISISEIVTGKITDKRLSDFSDAEGDRERSSYLHPGQQVFQKV
jgi:long-chain acyl-CoA synthetase